MFHLRIKKIGLVDHCVEVSNPEQNMKNTVDPGSVILVKPDHNWTSSIGQKESENNVTYSRSKGNCYRFLGVVLKSLSSLVALLFVIPISILYKIEQLFKGLLNRNRTRTCADELPSPDEVIIFEDSDRFWPHGDINDADIENYRRNLRECVQNWMINNDETSENHIKEELFHIGKYEEKTRLAALLQEMRSYDGMTTPLLVFFREQ